MRRSVPDNERLKSWVSVLIVLAVFAVVGFLLRDAIMPRHFRQGLGNSDPNAIPPSVALRLRQSVFTGHDALGRKAWTVRADRVDASIDKSRIEFVGHVEAHLLDAPSGKSRATVNAPYGVFTTRTKTLQVGSKMVCRVPGNGDAKDMRLEADMLLWNVGAKQIVCPGAVHADLASGGGTADGRDMTMDLTTHEWTLKRFHGAFLLSEGAGSAPPPFANPLGKLPL